MAFGDAGVSEITTADLVEQTLDTSISTPLLRIMSDNTVDYNEANPSNGDLGWFFDLPTSGERLIVDPVIRLEQVFLATTIPDTQACVDGGGTGWIMILDAENGGEPSQGGFDIDGNGVIDLGDQISSKFAAGIKFTGGLPGGLGFLGGSNNLYITGTSGGGNNIADSVTIESIKGIPGFGKSRLSWKELAE